MAGVDWSQVGVVLVQGAGNIGAMFALVKIYAGKVDKHSELVPVMAESLKTISETLKTTGESIKELYESRNDQKVDIERLKLTHEMNGCNLPAGKEGKGGS